MSITVKLTDATIALGGDFASALDLIKSIAGRRYDGPTKTWSIPIDLKAFAPYAAGRPFDIRDAVKVHRAGEHVTRWGTRYSSNEWGAKRAVDAIQVPDALLDAAQANREAAEQRFVATLRSFGMNDATIAKLRGLYDRFAGDLDDAVACGHIAFSSPARQAAIEAAFDAYYDGMNNADSAIGDFLAVAERRIADEHGLL